MNLFVGCICWCRLSLHTVWRIWNSLTAFCPHSSPPSWYTHSLDCADSRIIFVSHGAICVSRGVPSQFWNVCTGPGFAPVYKCMHEAQSTGDGMGSPLTVVETGLNLKCSPQGIVCGCPHAVVTLNGTSALSSIQSFMQMWCIAGVCRIHSVRHRLPLV